MKNIAKFLTGLMLAVALLIGLYIFTSRLSCTVEVKVVPAYQRESVFLALTEDLDEAPLSAEDCCFVTFTVTAKNYSLMPAEWTQLTLRPADEDILVAESDIGPKDIPSMGFDTFSTTVLTKSGSIPRSGWLEYYIFGRHHSLNVASET